jgi:hypothetical protein
LNIPKRQQWTCTGEETSSVLFSVSAGPRNVRDQHGLRLGEILNLPWSAAGSACENVNTFSTIPKPEDSGRISGLLSRMPADKAGLDDVTWDTFRHTFASRLTRQGADLVTVKELLGHSSVSATMRYAHTNRDAKKRAVGLIAGNRAKLVTLPIAR